MKKTHIREAVTKVLNRVSEEPPEYFFHSDTYEIDGEEHFGSVIDVEFRSSGTLIYLGCIVNLGSVYDYTIKLNTRTGILKANNSTDRPLKRRFDPEKCEAVDVLWQNAYDERRKQCCS